VIHQYVLEPRNDPRLAADYLWGLCHFDAESDCMIQLAEQWGDERIVQAVKQRQQREIEIKQHSRKQ
jgi:hypothetical protein